ncbi:elongation factor P maturation arginine rhamnosyltransferase EarP [Neisseriaceae bacterium ESL0693]|nr:elongation factor P maturation arginine rhamnosyltransferase EarP [Neisseriaceae bacterium ESL0693]
MSLIVPFSSDGHIERASVWLFVRVIDNFGDAGVGWRLATGLAHELNLTVYLWVDEPAVLAQLMPADHQQSAALIHVLPWRSDEEVARQLQDLADPHWVIETFGCDLPAPVLARMTRCRPLWLNWEYLSVEDWAVEMHGMPSLQPNALAKYFWFMGIDEKSGGLLREPDYQARQLAFQSDPLQQAAFCRQYGLPLSHQGALWLIFAYDADIWPAWLAMWQHGGQPVTLWLAGSQVIHSLQRLGVIPVTALQEAGDQYQCGVVTLVQIPFVPQPAFDQLLWLADGAVVRGEDSLTRALWAGLPFFWHIYPQAEEAHWPKLHAFWHKVADQWPCAWADDFRLLSDDMNDVVKLTSAGRLAAWQRLMQHQSAWQQAAKTASLTLYDVPTAMEKLARFQHDTLK